MQGDYFSNVRLSRDVEPILGYALTLRHPLLGRIDGDNHRHVAGLRELNLEEGTIRLLYRDRDVVLVRIPTGNGLFNLHILVELTFHLIESRITHFQRERQNTAQMTDCGLLRLGGAVDDVLDEFDW